MESPLRLLENDPRSPTTEFTRTPIMTWNKNSKSDTLLQNKHTENVRKILLCSNAYKAALAQQTQNENISPRLIETSTKIVKQAEKRKSYVGLLETNLDFQETDLDNVSTTKHNENESKIRTPVTPSIPILKNIDADPRSPTTDFLRTPIQIVKKIGEIDINSDVVISDNENVTSVPDDELQEEIDVTDLENLAKDNLTNDTECTNKIEDVIENVSSDSNNVSDTKNMTQFSTRKPLGDYDTNSTTISIAKTKKTNKLKVNDKPTKRISKIPIYKSKLIQGKMLPCENTPPQNDFNVNNKGKTKSEWDANKSIII